MRMVQARMSALSLPYHLVVPAAPSARGYWAKPKFGFAPSHRTVLEDHEIKQQNAGQLFFFTFSGTPEDGKRELLKLLTNFSVATR